MPTLVTNVLSDAPAPHDGRVALERVDVRFGRRRTMTSSSSSSSSSSRESAAVRSGRRLAGERRRTTRRVVGMISSSLRISPQPAGASAHAPCG